jgi:hypothetical protein
MFNNLIGKNKELGRFLFCERYTLQPVKDAMYIAEGQELKRGAVVDVNGVLVGTNSLMPYAVLEFDCDTRSGGKEASVFIKGEFNFDKLYFADGLEKSDLDNIVYNANGLGIVIKPYEYAEGFSPSMVPAGTSEDNPLITAADTERMILETIKPAAKTLRFSFSKLDYSPVVAGVGSSGTWTKVSKYADNNIWDWTKSSVIWDNSFKEAFKDSENLVSIISAGDLSEITSINYFINACSQLINCVDLNLTSCTAIGYMFSGCLNIEKIPNLSTTVVAHCQYAFANCYKVKTGSLNMYTLLSSQQTPPSNKSSCFTNCGRDTTTGAAELAQIPASWGGTGT